VPIVYGSGPNTATLAIVGEMPGAEEARQGKPFVGPSGRLLSALLQKVGINRSHVYITNVVKRYHPDGIAAIPRDEIEEWTKFLTVELKKLNHLNVIVGLGNTALHALTGKENITRWRGSVLPCTLLPGKKAICTFHPAATLRTDYKTNAQYMASMLYDFDKIKREREFPELRATPREFILKPSLREITHHLQRMRASSLVAIDIETSGNGIVCIGFSDSPTWAMCVQLHRSTQDEILEVLLDVKDFLEGPTPKCGHNIIFDMLWLRRYGIEVNNVVIDTMHAHQALGFQELPHKLSFLTSVYTDVPYYKDDAKEAFRFRNPDQLYEYNCKDCCVTREIAEKFLSMVDYAFYKAHYLDLLPVMLDMEWKGIRVDEAMRQRMIAQQTEKLAALKRDIDHEVGADFNPLSPKQCATLLYHKLGYATRRKRRSGAMTTDEHALRSIYNSEGHPKIIELILKYREAHKLLTFYNKEPYKGTIRTNYSFTKTGRFASKESVFGVGTNLQNIPHEARVIFIPDREDMSFIKADLSQAEARIVAYLAQETNQMQIFESGGDIHMFNARIIFGENATKAQRDIAKRGVHATNYGMRGLKLSEVLSLFGYEFSPVQCDQFIERYFAACPKIPTWQAETKAFIAKHRLLVNPYGRFRLFFGRLDEEAFRDGFSWVPQSTVPDYLNKHGLIPLHHWLNEHQYGRVVLQVHDDFLLCVYDQYVDDVCRKITSLFDAEIPKLGLKIPIEISVGKNWRDMEKWQG
jgi:DNA polymerase-1